MRKNSVAAAAASLAAFIFLAGYEAAAISYVTTTQDNFHSAYDFSADDSAWLAAFDTGSAETLDVFGEPVQPNPADLATPGFVARLQGFGKAQDLQVVVISHSHPRICADDRIHAWGRFQRVGEGGKLFLPPRGGLTAYRDIHGSARWALLSHLLGLDCEKV